MNRKDIEKYIYRVLDAITGTKRNSDIYREYLSKMNDKTFGNWLRRLAEEKAKLSIVVPNGAKEQLNTAACLKEADKIGHNFFTKMEVTGKDLDFTTPVEVLVLITPVRRPSQSMVKKISVAKNDNQVDNMTGQPTSASKASGISYPESQIISGLNLKHTATEFSKVRGGDLGSYRAMVASMEQTGEVSQETIAPYATGVESTKTLNSFLIIKHIGTNL